MPPTAFVYRFGVFELDPASRRLMSGGERVRLTESQFAILLHLVLHAPGIVHRSALAQAGWSGTTSDENIEQAITGLRKELSKRDGIACIETVPGGGYRFVAPLERREPDRPLALLGADGDGLQAFVQGRDGVATLNQGPIADNDVRHWLRLAHVGWKGERIAAAEKMRALRPDLAVACWLQATVYVALGALEPALTVLHAGCAAQDRQRDFPSDYPAVGLHLLRGLVYAAQERLDDAEQEFAAELADLGRGPLYSRECAANTWYARGAVYVRRGQVREANAAFERALENEPGHLWSLAALGRPLPRLSPDHPRALDAGIARAIALTRAGRHADAAQVFREAVMSSGIAHAGWILPVEPILHAYARPEIWGDMLATIRDRAT